MKKHGESLETVCGIGNSSARFSGVEKVKKITYHERTRSYSWPDSTREASPETRYSVF